MNYAWNNNTLAGGRDGEGAEMYTKHTHSLARGTGIDMLMNYSATVTLFSLELKNMGREVEK